MKKIIAFVCAAISMVLIVTAFAACGGEGDTRPGGMNTYVMEAEYINLDGIQGAGLSNQAKGVNMIYGNGTAAEKELGWSNGYYVGFTYAAGITLNFTFTADNAESATIILRLGSEIGDLMLTPSDVAVKLNGEDINYASMQVATSPSMAEMSFTDKTVTSSALLQKGENTLSIMILENTLHGGQPGGPMVDCVKITTKAGLTWTDKTDNPDRRGSILG